MFVEKTNKAFLFRLLLQKYRITRMKPLKIQWYYIESIIYLFLWGILLFPPFLFRGDLPNVDKHLIANLYKVLPFFIIFLINNFVLVPKFLLNDQTKQYFFFVLILIILVVVFDYYLKKQLLDMYDINNRPRFRHSPMKLIPMRHSWELMLLNNIVIAFLIVGFNTSLKVSGKWMEDENKRKELEKENIESKLAFLQYQISPHFFMNTLNNIHALVDIDHQASKEAIIRLSNLMRHLLYDTDKPKVKLESEFDLIRNYIDLMRIRLKEGISLNLKYDENLSNIFVPPLLFISFVENAFKHGVSYIEPSFIEIEFKKNNNKLEFIVRNSNHQQRNATEGRTGIGLINAKKRLDLIFGNRYRLDFFETKQDFLVQLIIPYETI